MKVLIIGSGAREQALIQALYRSPQSPELYCYANLVNPAIKRLTHEYHLGQLTDCQTILALAKQWQIDMAIIGPEAPLEKGLADLLWEASIPTIGPKKILARLETSKGFTRDLMQSYQIPGLPLYQRFNSLDNLEAFLHELGEGQYVIKADGLMGGKGVKVADEHLHSISEALVFCQQLLANQQTFLVEEKLIGQEFSFMCFADGKQLIPMPLVQDHKRAYEGDKGPNTGGMGSYSDYNHRLPFLTEDEVNRAFAINQTVFHALSEISGEKYIGIFYGSFIATRRGLFVIEFNARFGDPEALNVLTILESDFLAICQAMTTGNLDKVDICFAHQATVCKYVVPEGYPENPMKDFIVDFSRVNKQEHLYLASVYENNGQIFAAGSRTAAYVGVADTIFAAEAQVENEISRIDGKLFHRCDIGTPALIQQYIDTMVRLKKACVV